MRDPLNIISIEYQDNKFNIIKMSDIPEFDYEDYNLLDDKDLEKFFSDVEKICRNSFEYKEYIKYLRENMGMNECSFYENVNNIETTKIKIHIHHHPFTLYDIVTIVYRKRVAMGENVDAEMVAKEVMYLHYNLLVGLIPLAETPHELVHNSLLFIPLSKVLGHFKDFANMYIEFIPQELLEILDRNIEYSDKYDEYENNRILEKNYVYIDLSDEHQGLPTYEELIQIMNNKIKEIKHEEEQPMLRNAITFDK